MAVCQVPATSDFAVEVTAAEGSFNGSRYRNPNAVLGKPAVQCLNDRLWDPTLPVSFRVKLVEAAYNLSLDGAGVITTINPGESITVKFDHPVVDYPQNPFGQDFIVFGNAFFQYSQQVKISDQTNLNTVLLANPAQTAFGQIIVSVSQDGQIWHTFENGPWADDLFPTQAYQWDRANARWTDIEMDFTRPVDPNLTLADFSGLTAAEAIDLYAGSAGGTSFDLNDLPHYDQLLPDPNSGYRWIQYVRLEGGQGPFALGGQVDAVADVAACGDPTHPYPSGDITRDCRVDMADLAIVAASWLECTYKCE
ncbi:MAG TPA: hypothetical protein P5175_11865 [Anaerohalosphaeraceae bacterium]|nr:hypothetical protein [Phycisphaerae bacterium]HOM75742.1 hypothetical protein [Anaerohalosphaeraceae bacterium]HPC64458.1 hypothetical protein [Anaerohalosphaeraceae bacterium]HPO69710.1 hypothetical protein [Anaerohalosphaeraceae bacterium]HRS72530.1 hypothetical protein [Anaerohalosphaeraceae bacterium]